MKTYKIERSNFKLIETELYNYYETKKRLEDEKKNIIEATPHFDVSVQSSFISSTTENKALKLTSLELLEIEKRLRAIETVIDELRKNDVMKYKFLILRYFEKRRYFDILESLNIEQATYYRWRKEIIQKIANLLGWKV